MFAVHHRPLFYGDSCHRAAGMEEHGLLMHVAGNANVHGAENVARAGRSTRLPPLGSIGS